MKMVTLQSLVSRISQSAGREKYPILSITAGVGFVNQAEKFGREIAGAQYIHYTVLKKGDFSYNKGNSKAYPQGCIYCLEKLSQAAVPNVFNSFRFVSEKALPAYYKYVFESGFLNKQLYRCINSGVRNDGLLNLYDDDFYSCQVPCPPIEEQRKIAEILGCCDEIIRLKKEQIAEKKKQKKALMQKLLDPNSGFRLPGFSGEWKNLKLHECGSFRKGSGISSTDCRNTGKPCVKYGDIYMSFNTAFSQAVSCIAEEMFNCCLQVCRGTLLFTCSGEDPLEIGKCVVYLGKDPIAVGGDLIAMFPYDEANSLFLAYQQDSATLIKQKAVLSKGNSIVHIHLSEIQELKIQLPPTQEEQQAIADILLAADQEIDLLEQELTEQEKKKKSLMQLLLTGIVSTN